MKVIVRTINDNKNKSWIICHGCNGACNIQDCFMKIKGGGVMINLSKKAELSVFNVSVNNEMTILGYLKDNLCQNFHHTYNTN